LKSFGQYLKEKRKLNNWTLPELGEKLNLDAYVIHKIEEDWRKFPSEKLEELAIILDVVPIELEQVYIKTDLLLNFAHIKNYREKIISILSGTETDENLSNIITGGENRLVEFKSTLRYCLKSKKPEKHIEFSVIKNLCAFLNTNGGKLILGVDDNGKIIGLDSTDFTTFQGTNKIDEFLKQLDNLINKYFGNQHSNFFDISFKEIEQKTIAIIDVASNNRNPTFIKAINDNKEAFYIRRNASAISLSMAEFYDYAKDKWKNNLG
jgi:transcriptional regulator with XRE-family HTH domain